MTFVFWGAGAVAAFAAAYAAAQPLMRGSKNTAFALLAAVPVATLGLYLYLGNPDMPDAPLTPRLDGPLEELPPAAILARLEDELRTRSNDVEGWRLMARLRVTVGDHARAADAWQRLLDLSAGDVEAQVGLAQALIEQDGGVISAAAVGLLDAALKTAPDNLAAQFWRGEAWMQQGDPAAAGRLWRQLRAQLDDAMPLAQMLDRRLADLP